MTHDAMSDGSYGSHRAADERTRYLPTAATVADVQAAANNVGEYVRTLVRQQPVVAVLTSVGVGYMMARLIARGMR